MGQDDHNKGQRDAARGVYERPHNDLDYLSDIINPFGNPEKRDEENADYDAGWEHTDSQKRGCFLSTACVRAAGLPDDCDELETLRTFRNEYVLTLPAGPSMIEEYYRVAPGLVEAINSSANRTHVWRHVYHRLLQIIEAIRDARSDHAVVLYESLVSDLRSEFLRN